MKSAMNFLVLIFTILVLTNAAHAESPREQLKQMVEQLQQKPDDNALREKIIKLAATIKPAPAVPEGARRFYIEGNTITGSANDAKQELLAVESYKEALKIAPWWDDAYYNLSFAQELAGQFDDAEESLKLYLLTNPPAKEAREAQDRIYALSAKKRLKQRDYEEKINELGNRLVGAMYVDADPESSVFTYYKFLGGDKCEQEQRDEAAHTVITFICKIELTRDRRDDRFLLLHGYDAQANTMMYYQLLEISADAKTLRVIEGTLGIGENEIWHRQ